MIHGRGDNFPSIQPLNNLSGKKKIISINNQTDGNVKNLATPDLISKLIPIGIQQQQQQQKLCKCCGIENKIQLEVDASANKSLSASFA